jgi:hypothetical protein
MRFCVSPPHVHPTPQTHPQTPTPQQQQRARSQVSTAVSFEGARPAGSAALPSRSVDEESALSAAEADGALRGCLPAWFGCCCCCCCCCVVVMET